MAVKAPDAIAMLQGDDRSTEAMLGRIERREMTGAVKEALIADIAQALVLRAEVLYEIAFPAFRAAGVPAPLLDQAQIDQQAILELVDDLDTISHKSDLFDATIKALTYRVRRRVQTDELELWPAVRSSGANLVEIGRRLVVALMDEWGVEEA